MTGPRRVLSCIQPTSSVMHIGNFFGAVKNWVALQAEHRCIYGIVDLHAMTVPHRPADLEENTRRMVLDLLACGIDPRESELFVQSLVPEHAELAWILGCLTPYGQLGRMTQFKDKRGDLEGKGSESSVSAGLFVYPVLQAADILLYRADLVPVGRDQEQHLELSRLVAHRFNRHVGTAFFTPPQPAFTETPRIMSLADPTRKMSKSLGERHYIGLFEEEDTVRAKVRAAVTDSGPPADGLSISPGVNNLLQLLAACGRESLADTMKREYLARKLKYKHLKEVVAESLVGLTSEMRRSREEVSQRHGHLDLIAMSSGARAVARETMEEVRSLLGISGKPVALRREAREAALVGDR